MKSNSFKNALASTVLALIVTTPALSFGVSQGGTDGGGGNAIVCFNSEDIAKKIHANNGVIGEDMLKSIRSIETYDLAYAKLATLDRKPKIVAIQDNEGFDQYARRIAKRISMDEPRISWLVETGLKLLKYDRALIREAGVMSISDMADVGVVDTSKCVVTTMAVQKLGELNPLHLDGRLFQHPKHTRQSQAILILHEILYAAAREWAGAKDSAGVRELIRMIATEGAGYTRAELNSLMNDKFKVNYDAFDKLYWSRDTVIVGEAIHPLLLQSFDLGYAFQVALGKIEAKSFFKAQYSNRMDVGSLACLADAQVRAQMDSVYENLPSTQEKCKYALRIWDGQEEQVQKAKELWNEYYYAVYIKDVEKYNVDNIWGSSIQAKMDQEKVRPEIQAFLKDVLNTKLKSILSSVLTRGYFNIKELWVELDKTRKSNLELP